MEFTKRELRDTRFALLNRVQRQMDSEQFNKQCLDIKDKIKDNKQNLNRRGFKIEPIEENFIKKTRVGLLNKRRYL